MRTLSVAGATHVAVGELADQIGIDRSNLHRKIKRAAVPTVKVPRITDGGLQQVSAVPMSYARSLIALYDEARRNG